MLQLSLEAHLVECSSVYFEVHTLIDITCVPYRHVNKIAMMDYTFVRICRNILLAHFDCLSHVLFEVPIVAFVCAFKHATSYTQ